MIPLHALASISKPLHHLNPVLEIDDEKLVLSTVELAGVPVATLGEVVGNVRNYREEIINTTKNLNKIANNGLVAIDFKSLTEFTEVFGELIKDSEPSKLN